MHGQLMRLIRLINNPVVVLLSLGIGLEICFVGLVCLGDLGAQVIPFLVSFTLSFIIYLAALSLLPTLIKSNRPSNKYGLSIMIILVFSFIFRITIIFSPPSLSDDIYRYLWEGRLVNEGENPFLNPPASEALSSYQNQYYEPINNKEVPTIYPPLAQYLFALSQILSPHPAAFKTMMAIIDMILVFILWRVLLFKGINPRRIVIYAWHPLPVIEFSGSGHIDVAAIALFVGALYLFLKNQKGGSLLALVFSILVKFFAFSLAPFFWFHGHRIRLMIILFGISFLFYLPFIEAGFNLLRGGMTYASRWHYNASLFDLLVWVTGSVSLSKVIILAAFSFAALLLGWKGSDPFKIAFFLTGLFLVLTPTLHPWYAAWIIPFLCLYPRWSWLYFSGAVMLSYYVLKGYGLTGEWIEAPWVRVVEYLPFFSLLFWELGTSIVLKKKGSN